jgi:hypothetical protein
MRSFVTWYYSPDIIRMIRSRRMKRSVHVARIVEKRDAYMVLVGKLEGKKPLRRPGRRWENNIELGLEK